MLRRSRRPTDRTVAHKYLARDISGWLKRGAGAIVVDHPLLVELLAAGNDNRPLIYIHGELVAPAESLTLGADLTLVPTVEVRERFLEAGAAPEKVIVTGLCLERRLVSRVDEWRTARLLRLSTGDPLTGAFFSSGAEPAEHCARIVSCADSLCSSGQRSVVFAKHGGRLERLVLRGKTNRIELVSYGTISEEEVLLADVFGDLDFYVSPAHERTNWALGLGLPFFILGPDFGSFAPLNRRVAEKRASAVVVDPLQTPSEFNVFIAELRKSGRLERMNVRAYEDIEGFRVAAEAALSVA